MTSLEALQRLLVDGLQRGTDARDPAFLGDLSRIVKPSARGMSPAERFEVYREQYWLRHLANLEEDYPTLGHVLGAADLRELLVDYLHAHPPSTWNLQRLGAALPDFVERRVPADRPSAARDAARIDWAFVEAFDAPDVPPFDARALTSVPEDAWPGARITFHPSLRPLDLGHHVHVLRERIARGERAAPLVPEPASVVVWRDPGCHLRAQEIEPLAARLLGTLRAGVALGAACELVAGAPGAAGAADLEPRIAAWFQQWTALAWVRAVTFPT
jgi:hypothetical protein